MSSKHLSGKNNKKIGIYLFLILLIALFTLLYAVNKNTEKRQFAQVPISYPQPTPSPEPTYQSTWFATRYARFAADSFFIRIGTKYFRGKEPFSIRTDPGLDNQTIEVTWFENNVEMRFNLYFRRNTTIGWELYDVRSYNGQASGNWISYKNSINSTIENQMGYESRLSVVKFVPTQSGVDAEISCSNCAFYPFIPQDTRMFSSGYSLEARIGLPIDKVITVSPNTSTGYGVNVVLRDSNGQIVNPANFRYEWNSDHPTIAVVSGNAQNGQIQGLKWGTANINVRAVLATDYRIQAATSFPVRVAESSDELNRNKPECSIAAFADDPANNPPNYVISQKVNLVNPGQQFVIATNFFNRTGKEYQTAFDHVSLGNYLKFVDSNGTDCAVDDVSKTISCKHGQFLNNGATSMAFRVKYIGSVAAPVSIFGTTFTSNGDTGSCSTTINTIPTFP